MSQIVTCPSGLKGEVRGFKAKEANLLADKVAMRSGTAFDGILAGCWLKTVDPGPYNIKDGGAPNWGKTLVCDRFASLIAVRAETYGDDYAFKLPQCENNLCEQPIEWELKLSDLPRKELPASSIEIFKSGENRFPAELSDGTQLWFRLQTGDGELEAAKLMRSASTNLIVTALHSRILEVQGVPKHQLRTFLGELEMRELMSLMTQFDEHDGGVETQIDVECPHCGRQQRVELPLGRDFFLPKMKLPGSTR